VVLAVIPLLGLGKSKAVEEVLLILGVMFLVSCDVSTTMTCSALLDL
jgi:hypothetical protein